MALFQTLLCLPKERHELMLIICATQIEAVGVQNETELGPERNKEEAKMELLATYGDDGEKSESPGPSSDVGEKVMNFQ